LELKLVNHCSAVCSGATMLGVLVELAGGAGVVPAAAVDGAGAWAGTLLLLVDASAVTFAKADWQ
jgi:hypothetical protein